MVGTETIQHGCHGYSTFCEAEELLSIGHSCLFCNENGLVMSNGIRLSGELWRYKRDKLITAQYKRFFTSMFSTVMVTGIIILDQTSRMFSVLLQLTSTVCNFC